MSKVLGTEPGVRQATTSQAPALLSEAERRAMSTWEHFLRIDQMMLRHEAESNGDDDNAFNTYTKQDAEIGRLRQERLAAIQAGEYATLTAGLNSNRHAIWFELSMQLFEIRSVNPGAAYSLAERLLFTPEGVLRHEDGNIYANYGFFGETDAEWREHASDLFSGAMTGVQPGFPRPVEIESDPAVREAIAYILGEAQGFPHGDDHHQHVFNVFNAGSEFPDHQVAG